MKVASLPSGEIAPDRNNVPLAVKMRMPFKDCSALVKAILMLWLIETWVVPSAGSNDTADMGVSFRMMVPVSTFCPLAVRLNPVRTACPVLTGSLMRTEIPPSGRPLALKVPSVCACTIAEPPRSSCRAILAPAAGVTPSERNTVPLTDPLGCTCTLMSVFLLGCTLAEVEPNSVTRPDWALKLAVKLPASTCGTVKLPSELVSKAKLYGNVPVPKMETCPAIGLLAESRVCPLIDPTPFNRILVCTVEPPTTFTLDCP